MKSPRSLHARASLAVAAVGLTVAAGHVVAAPGVPERRLQDEAEYPLHLPMLFSDAGVDDLPPPATALPSPSSTHLPTATATNLSTSTPSPTPTATSLPSSIRGRITLQGEPLFPGIGSVPTGPQIELRRLEGGSSLIVTTTVTMENGAYHFLNPPPLPANAAYQVWWDVDPYLFQGQWLTRWMTRPVEQFGPGDQVDLGTFDVGDLQLTRPENFWWNTLPLDFGWSARRGVDDEYGWVLSRRCGFNSNDIDRRDVARSEPLGPSTRYRLDALPRGTEFRTHYCWYVEIEDGEGGRGWPLLYRHIWFCADTPCGPFPLGYGPP